MTGFGRSVSSSERRRWGAKRPSKVRPTEVVFGQQVHQLMLRDSRQLSELVDRYARHDSLGDLA